MVKSDLVGRSVQTFKQGLVAGIKEAMWKGCCFCHLPGPTCHSLSRERPPQTQTLQRYVPFNVHLGKGQGEQQCLRSESGNSTSRVVPS